MVREIAEFNQAESWRADGTLSMPDWLVARLRVSASRARRLVEASERLSSLPALSAALSGGTSPARRGGLGRKGRHHGERCRAGRGRRTMDAAASIPTGIGGQGGDSEGLSRRVQTALRAVQRRAVLDVGATAERRLCPGQVHAVDDGTAPRSSEQERPGLRALREPMCRRVGRGVYSRWAAWVTGFRKHGESGAGRATVIVHADLDRLLHGDGYGTPRSKERDRYRPRWPAVWPATPRSRCLPGCAGRQRARSAGDRTGPHGAQRIEIRRRDGGCRFPGCTCRSVTDVHHVTWVSKQGPTVMSNLLTLCVAHHSRVHELGWKLDGDAQDEVRFISPSGRVLTSMPMPTWRRRPRK